MKALAWKAVRKVLLQLAVNLRKYAQYIDSKNATMQTSHSSVKTSFSDHKAMFQIKEAMLTTKPTLVAHYKTLSNVIASSNDYEVMCQ